MIDQIYIECAKNIRTAYLKQTNKLENYEKEQKDLYSYLQNVTQELENFTKTDIANIKTKNDITNASDYIIKKMEEMANEEQKLLRLITPVVEEIDKLRLEEQSLVGEIRKKYPKLNIEDIAKEIQNYLDK